MVDFLVTNSDTVIMVVGLVISEMLALVPGPYNGIVQGIFKLIVERQNATRA